MRKVDNSWQTKECVLIAVGHWFGSMWCKVGHENISLQVLTKFNLADAYKGQEDPDGEDYNVEAAEDGPRPFTCLLDTGLKRTSTGSKVFAALKVAFSVHVHNAPHCFKGLSNARKWDYNDCTAIHYSGSLPVTGRPNLASRGCYVWEAHYVVLLSVTYKRKNF